MWDGLLQALGAAGTVLDTPGSIARGLLSGQAGRAFGGILDPSQRVYSEEWTGDPWSGMAVDMATDPLNLLGGVGLLKTARAAKFAKANNARKAASAAKSGPKLVVARQMPDGTIRYGKPGQIHADLVSAEELARIRNPGGNLADQGFPPPEESMGFAQPGGQFMSRDDALDFVKRHEPVGADKAHRLTGLEAGRYRKNIPVPTYTQDVVPSQSPLLAALLGYNAARGGRGLGGE